MLEKLLTISMKNKMQQFHWHDKLELFLVLQGSMELSSNGRKEYLHAGSLSLVNRDDVHCIEKAADDLLYMQMTIDILKFDPYLPGISKVYFRSTADKEDVFAENLKEEIRNYIAQIARMMDIDSNMIKDEQMIIYYCIQLLSNLKQGFNFIGQKINENIEYNKFDQLWEVMDYIYDNCNRKLTIKEVSEHIYVSPSYLRALIKEQAGVTFEEFVAFARVETSLKNLINSNLSITNIAYECGFSAPRYYYAAFQKAYHCTPAEYREKNGNFFRMEKVADAMDILYDTGVKKEKCLELLAQYNLYNSSESIKRIDIEVDIQNPLSQKGRLPEHKKIIRCNEKAILNFHYAEELRTCVEKLGIKYVIVDTESRTIKTALKSQLSVLGLEMIEKDNNHNQRFLDIHELFDIYGKRLPAYYVQEVLYRVKEPYTVINRNCAVYQAENELKILIYNDPGFESIKYRLEITGMEAGYDYLCSIKEVKKLSANMEALIERPESRTKLCEHELDSIMEPSLRYEAYRSDIPCILIGKLDKMEMVLVAIRKL